MKTAAQILKENPITKDEILGSADKVRKILERLIWLGMVEVIDHVSVNAEHMLELLKEIKGKK